MGKCLGEKGKPEIGPHTAVSHPVSKSYDFDFLFRPQANLSFLGEPTIMESEKVFFALLFSHGGGKKNTVRR